MSEKETQNLYANDDPRFVIDGIKVLGASRIKEPYIVVTNWWYQDVMHLINYCHLIARGWDLEEVPKSKEYPFGAKRLPPNLRMLSHLIDDDLLEGRTAYSQQYMPLKNKKWWRFKWWLYRMWRAIWMRERYKLDRYWMNRYENPEIN